MSETSVVPEGPAAPLSLLAQMQQLLAELDADLGRLDADLQSPPPPAPEELSQELSQQL